MAELNGISGSVVLEAMQGCDASLRHFAAAADVEEDERVARQDESIERKVVDRRAVAEVDILQVLSVL